MNKYKDPFVVKILQIGASLIGSPGSIPSYFAMRRQTPLQLGLPWISFGAIRFLNEFLCNHMRVFEYGSGGSTIYFARRCRNVTAVEDSEKWMDCVRKKLDELACFNVHLTFHATDKAEITNNEEFKRSTYLKAIDRQEADVVMIDGADEWMLKERRRSICFYYTEPMMKPGSIIIVDDSWAYPELRAKNRAKQVKTFRGVGPCRTGVTSTDVFFY